MVQPQSGHDASETMSKGTSYCLGITGKGPTEAVPTQLGHDVSLAQPSLCPGGVNTTPTGMPPETVAISAKHEYDPDYDRVLVEVCCNDDSILGQRTKESYGCRRYRITIRDDFTIHRGLNKRYGAYSQS